MSYIDPNPLPSWARAIAILLGSVEQLRGDERQHVLPALQESPPRDVIHPSLRLVEALKSFLLRSLSISSVRFDEAGVAEQKERRDETRVVIFLRLAKVRQPGISKSETNRECRSSKNKFSADVGR